MSISNQHTTQKAVSHIRHTFNTESLDASNLDISSNIDISDKPMKVSSNDVRSPDRMPDH